MGGAAVVGVGASGVTALVQLARRSLERGRGRRRGSSKVAHPPRTRTKKPRVRVEETPYISDRASLSLGRPREGGRDAL